MAAAVGNIVYHITGGIELKQTRESITAKAHTPCRNNPGKYNVACAHTTQTRKY